MLSFFVNTDFILYFYNERKSEKYWETIRKNAKNICNSSIVSYLDLNFNWLLEKVFSNSIRCSCRETKFSVQHSTHVICAFVCVYIGTLGRVKAFKKETNHVIIFLALSPKVPMMAVTVIVDGMALEQTLRQENMWLRLMMALAMILESH